MKNLKNYVISFGSSLFLLYTLTILDFLSFGTKIISPVCHKINIENFNMTIFTYTTIAAQILFGTFTGIKKGICGGAIIESQPIAEKIMKYCEEKTDNVTDCVTNVYACLVISTLLFALISLLLSYYGAGKFLQYIPKTALYGVMCSIGISLIKCGVGEIYRTEYKNHLHVCMLISIVLCLIAFYIDEKYPGYIFFIPCYCILIVGIFYGFKLVMGYDMDQLREYEYIPTSKDAKVSLSSITEFISLSKINLKLIFGSFQDIISLTALNLIHITVNIPCFLNEMKIEGDINSEFKAQGLSNLITAFLGYPTYFICSTSIFFNRSGGTKKIFSILGGFSLIPIVFIGPKVREYLPCILLSFIPIYIGGCFILSNLLCYIRLVSYLDLSVILISALFGVFSNPVTGLLVGSSLNAFIMAYYYSVKTKKLKSPIITDNRQVIKIDYMSYFMTIDMLKKDLNIRSGGVLIDLNDCKYLDFESNVILKDYVSDFNGNVLISGTPLNMYTKEFSGYFM
jgi:SulP family sulfate permease